MGTLRAQEALDKGLSGTVLGGSLNSLTPKPYGPTPLSLGGFWPRRGVAGEALAAEVCDCRVSGSPWSGSFSEASWVSGLG